MAKDYSFDVVCRTDLQEAANAVNQASKEIGTRYDFKGSKSSVSFDGSLITLIGDDDFKLRLVREIVNGKLVKRGISLKNIEEKKKESAAGGTVRQMLELKNGISSDLAKDIVKRIRGSKIKVMAKINGDELRISGRDKDDLQACIAFLKQEDIPVDLQFVNYRRRDILYIYEYRGNDGEGIAGGVYNRCNSNGCNEGCNSCH